MVVVKIWGGLGNQLFQYGFGRYLSSRLGTAVKFDVRTTSKLKSFTPRDFALSSFNINIETVTAKELKSANYFSSTGLARLKRKTAQKFPFLFKNYIVEPNLPVPAETLGLRDNCYYEGYWQSYKYLSVNEESLRKEITFRYGPSEKLASLISGMRSCNSASIHVRRGDYLNDENLSICKMPYYEKAIGYIKNIIPDARFYIFTDDLEWCRQNFTGPEFFFITGNEDFEDMLLMSSCRYNIIANSTFSWWSAWLNNNPGKIIVAPGRWHNRHSENYSELIPESWIKID